MDASSDHFLKTFIKHKLKTTVIANRLDQNRYRLVQLFLNRGGFKGWRQGRAPFSFCNRFFWNQFEELQTVLLEVELIINNAPLTYVHPNTIETCLTPNHLLFGIQLLYFPNTTSTVVRNLTVLSTTPDKINRISNHFLDCWRHEFTWDTTNIKIKYRLSKN